QNDQPDRDDAFDDRLRLWQFEVLQVGGGLELDSTARFDRPPEIEADDAHRRLTVLQGRGLRGSRLHFHLTGTASRSNAISSAPPWAIKKSAASPPGGDSCQMTMRT